MEDEILSINPNRSVLTDPYVIRLPDGHVRVTATSIAFPDTCPRCGSSPADTGVVLRFTNESNLSIKLPFCRRCGWTLNVTQYLFAAVFCASMFFVLPHVQSPAFHWISKVPSSIGPLAVFWISGWVAQQILQMLFKPGCLDKNRREEALANATGMRVLQTIVAAVPVRLMKRDFLFIAEQMLPLLDDKRVETAARNRGIRAKEGESAAKLLTAFLRKAEEGVIGKLIVETVILLSASKQADGGKVLRAAAQAYKVDPDAIALKVKHEFATKEKLSAKKDAAKVPTKPVKKAKAA